MTGRTHIGTSQNASTVVPPAGDLTFTATPRGPRFGLAGQFDDVRGHDRQAADALNRGPGVPRVEPGDDQNAIGPVALAGGGIGWAAAVVASNLPRWRGRSDLGWRHVARLLAAVGGRGGVDLSLTSR